MANLTNEYEKLVNYLEYQEKVNVKSTPKKAKKKVAKKAKTKAKSDTKKLLEEAKVDDFINLPQFNLGGPSQDFDSKSGFNIKSFESLMRAKLIEEHKTRQSYERPYISVSELYNCLRNNYYSRKRYQIDLKKQYNFPYLYLIQKIGNKIHDIILDLYDFTEVEKTLVSEKYKVKGRVDALKPKVVYELKSIDPDKFKGKFIKEHYYQGLIYAEILTTEYDYPIDTITIVYILRTLKKIRVFNVNSNPKMAKSLLSRAPILLTSLEANIIPETIGATNETCKYCLYKSYCKKDGYSKVIPPYIKPVTKKEETEEEDNSVFLL